MIISIESIDAHLAMKIAVGVFHKLAWCEKMLLPINGKHTLAHPMTYNNDISDMGRALIKDIQISTQGLDGHAIICGYKDLAMAHNSKFAEIEGPEIDIGFVIRAQITPREVSKYNSRGSAEYVQTQLLRRAVYDDKLIVIEGDRNMADLITYIVAMCEKRYENEEICCGISGRQ